MLDHNLLHSVAVARERKAVHRLFGEDVLHPTVVKGQPRHRIRSSAVGYFQPSLRPAGALRVVHLHEFEPGRRDLVDQLAIRAWIDPGALGLSGFAPRPIRLSGPGRAELRQERFGT
jgi:hypothetical protein